MDEIVQATVMTQIVGINVIGKYNNIFHIVLFLSNEFVHIFFCANEFLIFLSKFIDIQQFTDLAITNAIVSIVAIIVVHMDTVETEIIVTVTVIVIVIDVQINEGKEIKHFKLYRIQSHHI